MEATAEIEMGVGVGGTLAAVAGTETGGSATPPLEATTSLVWDEWTNAREWFDKPQTLCFLRLICLEKKQLDVYLLTDVLRG